MAGAAVVAVGIMGPKDIIASGKTGILVAENENEFADRIIKLFNQVKAKYSDIFEQDEEIR